MNARARWSRGVAVAAMAALAIGTLDPLEGFPLLVAGALMGSAASHLAGGVRRVPLLTGAVLVVAGAAALVTVSSMGGFGPHALPWSWAAVLLPYPVGYVFTLYGLVRLLLDLFRAQPHVS